MSSENITDRIRAYLRKNGFYAYRLKTAEISENYRKEYRTVADPANKRNLALQKNWEDIDSFGSPRHIIVVDLGGTNLNLFDVQVQDSKNIKVMKSASDSFYENKIYTPDILFGDLKSKLDQFILASEERASLENLVFIFSYPIEQLIREDGYIDAVCMRFIKEHKSQGLVGLQVGKEFQKFLRERGYPKVNISVTNDTPIHSFAAKGYEILHNAPFDTAMNIIVGTGCNVSSAYTDQQEKGLRVINTEFGDFHGAPLSTFDEEYEKKSNNAGVHLNEKMISGAYQHEIFKIITQGLIKEKILPENILDGWDLSSMDSGAIEKQLKKPTEEHKPLSFIWREINKRGGALCGIFLATVMSELFLHLKKKKMSIIIMETGSVIRKNEAFRDSLMDMMDLELGRMKHKDNIRYSFEHLEHQAAYGSVIFDTFSSQ